MPKKTLYIILTIIICLIITGVLIWYFVLKPKEVAAPTGGIDFTVPGQIKNEGRIKIISQEPVISLSQINGEIFFYDFSGQLWQTPNEENKPIAVEEMSINNLIDVVWSKDAKNIVKTGSEQADIKYILSDPAKKALVNLKSGIKSVAFSPDSKKIAYYFSPNSRENSLFTSDPDGKNQRTLSLELNLRDITINWPNANTIALASKPSGLVAGNLWFFDIRNFAINKIIDDLFGLEVLFSTDGSSFIYSYANEKGQDLKLAVYDAKGNSKIINNVSTLVDKCVFTKDQLNIYCAVPQSWPDFAVLPDDYYKNAFTTNDDIWKINTETGEKTLVFENISSISNLAVSEDDANIFFISRDNQLLFKLNLK
ncbi:MAG: hypothetical protein AAB648_02210 [Patescibacteria group bacterium]